MLREGLTAETRGEGETDRDNGSAAGRRKRPRLTCQPTPVAKPAIRGGEASPGESRAARTGHRFTTATSGALFSHLHASAIGEGHGGRILEKKRE